MVKIKERNGLSHMTHKKACKSLFFSFLLPFFPSLRLSFLSPFSLLSLSFPSPFSLPLSPSFSLFLLLSFSPSLALFLFLCLYVAQGVGVLRSRLPASLCRAPIDGPGLQPTDVKGHTKCVARALVPTLAAKAPHVCHRQGTGLSPLASTCSRTWTFPSRLHI